MPRQRATRKVAGKAQWGVPQESWGYHPPLAWMLIVRLDVSGAMYPQESWGCHPTLASSLVRYLSVLTHQARKDCLFLPSKLSLPHRNPTPPRPEKPIVLAFWVIFHDFPIGLG